MFFGAPKNGVLNQRYTIAICNYVINSDITAVSGTSFYFELAILTTLTKNQHLGTNCRKKSQTNENGAWYLAALHAAVMSTNVID